MKHWTQREARAGVTVSPDALNNELRAQQSSITTLDRSQLPVNLVDHNNSELNSFAQVWQARAYGNNGEQQAARDTKTLGNAFQCISYSTGISGWVNAFTSSITLTGFKGGTLFGEWSGNAFVNPGFAATLNNNFPGSPKYCGFRILVNGVPLVERRGVALHEHFRVMGVGRFPQGDLQVDLQIHITDIDTNEPTTAVAVGNANLPQVHVYSNRYLFVGRYR
jgi:hypothetical protein